MRRDILDYNGNKIGDMELPDDTSEQVWAEKLAPYAAGPGSLSMATIVSNKIMNYRKLAPGLLVDFYTQNTLAGITTAQSDQMFDDYADVLNRLREGCWPTALYRLQQKTPSGFVTQAILDAWVNLITSHL